MGHCVNGFNCGRFSFVYEKKWVEYGYKLIYGLLFKVGLTVKAGYIS